MSNLYYINKDASKNPNNNNEIHVLGCKWSPDDTEYLGLFNNGVEAKIEAIKKGWTNADGCSTCCPEAHTG